MKNEPVLAMAAARLAALLTLHFGFSVNSDLLVALWIAVEGVLAGITRSKVTPVAKPPTVPPAATGLIAVVLMGCSATQLASTIATADAVGRGVAHVLGWCEANGANPADVVTAVKETKDGDYSDAIALVQQMVDAAKANGKIVPPETQTMLDLAKEALAARGVEQGMRALSGRNPDGSPKP